MTDHKV